MFLRQGVSLSVVVLAGALISACVSSPTKTGLSEFGRYQCGQLEVT
ncbi:MAG TPA: secreted protein containing HslJ-like protein, partial [Marinobacter hydrocarbonoclasticus]|nr:secreted protein containing HslJ-like protein [Marinobacter nauticus]